MNPIRSFFLRTCPFVFALAASIAPQMHGQILAVYEPDASATVSAPIVGLGATESDYLLTSLTNTTSLDRNFDGNNQNVSLGWEEGNPASARDAASLDNDYMFQLGTDNNIRRVNLEDGELDVPFGIIGAGAHTFGIGYDAGTDTLGWGRFDGSEMIFATYHVGTATFGTPVTFAFDAALYGTPTGLDYVVKNGAARMLVGTRDGPGNILGPNNFILDMDAATGGLGQYATITGATSKLQDLLYENGRLATVFQTGSEGGIRVGDFTVIPEPKAAVLLAGLVALVATGLLRSARNRRRLR